MDHIYPRKLSTRFGSDNTCGDGDQVEIWPEPRLGSRPFRYWLAVRRKLSLVVLRHSLPIASPPTTRRGARDQLKLTPPFPAVGMREAILRNRNWVWFERESPPNTPRVPGGVGRRRAARLPSETKGISRWRRLTKCLIRLTCSPYAVQRPGNQHAKTRLAAQGRTTIGECHQRSRAASI